MDQKPVTKGGAIAAILLVLIGVIMMPFGILVLASYPGEFWPLGLILLFCSVLVLVAAIRSYMRSSRKLTHTPEQINQIQKKSISESINISSPGKTLHSVETGMPVKSNLVLADWVYSREEWMRYTNWERRTKKWIIIFLTLSVTIISAFFLIGSRDAPWAVALGISSIAGFLYYIFSYRFALNSIGKGGNAPNTIIITTNAVLINDKLHLFANGERWVSEIAILEDPSPKILQITYHWKTSQGEKSANIHVPIPKGKLGEAVMLMGRLNRES